MNYRDVGVDIDAADAAKKRIAAMVAATHGPEVLRGLGHFGGFFQAPGESNPHVLVSSADSVGTKILLAMHADQHEGIGVDVVNHCVNDILACGARPLFFLDYIAAAHLEARVVEQLVAGMTHACQEAGCALIGGETAQLPGVYKAGAYDLAGFIVGSVHQDRIVDGQQIQAGDVLVGLPSSGLHTNGFSLARAALGLEMTEASRERLGHRVSWTDRTLADVLLAPHQSYLRAVLPVLDDGLVHGMAHVTGGGLAGNVSRVIPDGLQAVIDTQSWGIPPLFRDIQDAGQIADAEMYRVFNMGIGFVLIVDPSHLNQVTARIGDAQVIGEIRAGTNQTKCRLLGVTDTST